jgi:GGDEF domain-containing protein
MPGSSSGDGEGGSGKGGHDESRANLVVIYGDRERLGKRYEVSFTGFKIGGLGQDFVISSCDGIGAEITTWPMGSGDWLLIPTNNAVTLNRTPARTRGRLKTGDYIEVGNVGFVFLCGDSMKSQYYELIYHLTIQDFSTGLHNKRYFHEALEREEIRAKRHQLALSIAVIDFSTVDSSEESIQRAMRQFARGLTGQLSRAVVARLNETEVGIICDETSQGALRHDLALHLQWMASLPPSEAVPIPRVGVAQWSEALRGEALVEIARRESRIQSIQ